MKQFTLLLFLLLSTSAIAGNPRFKECDSDACNEEKREALQQQIIAAVRSQSGYVMADSIYLEFSVNEEGKVKFLKEFSTSSMLTLIFAKKALKATAEELSPSSNGNYHWVWNVSLPKYTSSFTSITEAKNIPTLPECNTFNSKGKRGCFHYFMDGAADKMGVTVDEHMTLKLFIKKGKIVAAEAPHPPLIKATTDRLILSLNQYLQEVTTYSSRNNSENFWVEFNYTINGDSTTRYNGNIKRLKYLSSLPSKQVYHEELLDFKKDQYSQKPKEGAQFLITQLQPLGLAPTSPYKIGNRSYTLDSLLFVSKHGIEKDSAEENTFAFQHVESVPIYKSCAQHQGDNDQLKKCFQMEILTYVSKSFKFPETARQKGIQGRIYINFVILTDGTIDEIQIVRGIDPLLDYESIRVVSEIPDMDQPAMQNGKPVRMSFTLPINTILQ